MGGGGHTALGGSHRALGGQTALAGSAHSSGGHTEPWGGTHRALDGDGGGTHSPRGGHTQLWGSHRALGGHTALEEHTQSCGSVGGGGVQTAPGGAHTALTAALLHPQGLPGPPPPSDEDFGKGPWLTMKTELGVDERDPGCFLRTYSVVMVLRKVSSAPSHPPFTPPPPP